FANRLDPERIPVLVDEGHHHLRGRSSSAWAKNAAALRRISFACLSSRFSRSSALTRSRSASSACCSGICLRSAALTHLRRVSAVQPIFSATLLMAAHCDSYSPCCSKTSLTARSRTSGEYLPCLPMKPILSRKGPSGKAGGIHFSPSTGPADRFSPAAQPRFPLSHTQRRFEHPVRFPQCCHRRQARPDASLEASQERRTKHGAFHPRSPDNRHTQSVRLQLQQEITPAAPPSTRSS